MLRQLNSRELSGILAHEISHISSNDIMLMMIANVISRLTSIMAFAGFLLVWIYIPMFIFTSEQVPWLLLIILMTAPTFSALMQLALSRTREFNADAAAAKLGGDPLGLASALAKIERYQGGWFERMFTPSQHMREPVFFRTHPLMTDRIARLKELASTMQPSGKTVNYAESQSWLELPAPGHFPRRRFPWFWH
jgi:heat shock protein HtpX